MKILFVVCLLFGYSFQWGATGHKIIGELAWYMLDDGAEGKVSSFIGDNTIAWVAPIPDSYCHDYSEGEWSCECHFVNMPNGATQYENSYCGSCCVVGAINNYTTILTSEVTNPPFCDCVNNFGIEPCAFVFLTHFVGDVHQPLHVGWASDKGGNEVNVTYFGTPCNLHEVWDTKIIEQWDSNYHDAADQLQQMIKSDPDLVTKYTQSMDPVDWADESFDLVLSTVYNFTTVNGVGQIGEEYYDYHLPIIQQRLIAAGIRLGTLFNNLLSSFRIVIN